MSTRKVITGLVRFSYAHIFKPSSLNDGDEKKYSLSVIIDKGDTKTITDCKKAIGAAITDGQERGVIPKKLPKSFSTPLRDGDEDKPDDAAYRGKMFFNASGRQKPGVVDADRQYIIDPEECKSGDYGRVSITFYAYNVRGNMGIAAGLNNVQKLKDGERLGGGASAAQDFADLEPVEDLAAWGDDTFGDPAELSDATAEENTLW